MLAILWDGQKRIYGELILSSSCLEFVMKDFSETDLNLKIAYHDINEVGYHKLYEIEPHGILIRTENGNENVFVVHEPQALMDILQEKFVELE